MCVCTRGWIRFVWKIRELSHRVVGIATRNGIIVKKDARERRPIHTSRRSKVKFGKRLQKLTSQRNYVTVHRRCARINCRLRSKGGNERWKIAAANCRCLKKRPTTNERIANVINKKSSTILCRIQRKTRRWSIEGENLADRNVEERLKETGEIVKQRSKLVKSDGKDKEEFRCFQEATRGKVISIRLQT